MTIEIVQRFLESSVGKQISFPHPGQTGFPFLMVMFDSSNEAPGRTDCKAKNLSSLQCTVAEKNQEIPPKIVIFGKMIIFGGFS